jgi:hypothetical protein
MAEHIRISVPQMIRQYRRHTAVTSDGSKVIHLGRGLVDIFTGVEWLHQSRYRYADQRWLYIGGLRLSSGWVQNNLSVLNVKTR